MRNPTLRGWHATILLCAGILGAAPRLPAQPVAAAPGGSGSLPAGSLAETLRSRVDDLRYARQREARGGHIILGELVARYYESQQFQPAWQASGRLVARG